MSPTTTMSFAEQGLQQFLTRSEARKPLSDCARDAFLALEAEELEYSPHDQIAGEHERPERCHLVVEGVVSQNKTLANGHRQIMSFHFAGEFVDLHACHLLNNGHGIHAHTAVKLITLDCDRVSELAENSSEWAQAMWFDTLVDAGIFREWTLNVGRKTAVQRIAHLLLEFGSRLKAIGLSDGSTYDIPVTQADLADAVGLSSVHTNRSLQTLRREGLIRSVGRSLFIEKRKELERLASFDPGYLNPRIVTRVAANA